MKLVRLLAPALALAATLASAQNLDMNTGDPAAALPEHPARGSTMSQVETRFGAPTTKHAAVGDPPITRWDYPQFSVFFEHDKVLHAVGNTKAREVPEEPLAVNTGTLETFTTLFTTPEGIPSPRTLGFVSIPDGRLIMGRAAKEDLRIGQTVKVEKEGDLFYFQPSPPQPAPSPEKGMDGVKKWLHRALSSSDVKEDDR